jgi:hypothetical protein
MSGVEHSSSDGSPGEKVADQVWPVELLVNVVEAHEARPQHATRQGLRSIALSTV